MPIVRGHPVLPETSREHTLVTVLYNPAANDYDRVLDEAEHYLKHFQAGFCGKRSGPIYVQLDCVDVRRMGGALQYVGNSLRNYSVRTRSFAAAYAVPVDPRGIGYRIEAKPTFFPMKLKVGKVAVPPVTSVLESLRGGLEIELDGGVTREVQEDAELTEDQVRVKLSQAYDGRSGGTWDPQISLQSTPGKDTYRGRRVVNINPLPMEFEVVDGKDEDTIKIIASEEGQQMAMKFISPLQALLPRR